MNDRHVIRPAGMPDPGPARAYSYGVRADRTVYLAGQMGFTPEGELVPDCAGQARQAFRNIAAVLAAEGGTLDDLVTMTVYMTDLSDDEAFIAVRREVLTGPDYPASAFIGVDHLGGGGKIEICGIAVLRD